MLNTGTILPMPLGRNMTIDSLRHSRLLCGCPHLGHAIRRRTASEEEGVEGAGELGERKRLL
jgi:hypothetical protein